MEATPGVVLAVYAHPDDADVACGGTLARWAKAGGAVHLVVCTDGGKGTADPAVVPEELAARRAAELEASSALIGLASVDNLGFPDGELTDSKRRKLHDLLEAQFALDAAATDALIAEATADDRESVDFFHFTSLLMRTLDEAGRLRIV